MRVGLEGKGNGGVILMVGEGRVLPNMRNMYL